MAGNKDEAASSGMMFIPTLIKILILVAKFLEVEGKVTHTDMMIQ